MKKYLLSLLAMICSMNCSSGKETVPEPVDASQSAGNPKVLVVYYTRTGNTKQVADFIHAALESDLLELKTVEPYPELYSDILVQAQSELNAGYRPQLSTEVENWDAYEVIIVGHPIWHGHVPPPVQSFIAGYDFSGKTMAHFCTHGGSGVAQSRSDISRLCPHATLLESLAVSGSSAGNAGNSVTDWLRKIGVISAGNLKNK